MKKPETMKDLLQSCGIPTSNPKKKEARKKLEDEKIKEAHREGFFGHYEDVLI